MIDKGDILSKSASPLKNEVYLTVSASHDLE